MTSIKDPEASDPHPWNQTGSYKYLRWKAGVAARLTRCDQGDVMGWIMIRFVFIFVVLPAILSFISWVVLFLQQDPAARPIKSKTQLKSDRPAH